MPEAIDLKIELHRTQLAFFALQEQLIALQKEKVKALLVEAEGIKANERIPDNAAQTGAHE